MVGAYVFGAELIERAAEVALGVPKLGMVTKPRGENKKLALGPEGLFA